MNLFIQKQKKKNSIDSQSETRTLRENSNTIKQQRLYEKYKEFQKKNLTHFQ